MKEERKKRIQMQLRQFLKDYRNTNDLSAESAAEKLKVEISTYRALEGKKTTNRVISVLEYIDHFASLSSYSLTEFVAFLERSGRTESGSNVAKRKLYQWEIQLLDSFDKVGIPLRNLFLSRLQSKPPDELKASLKCLSEIIKMSTEKRQVLFDLVDVLGADSDNKEKKDV
jgi:transcriptional regulator with XRE-family HTH domain